MEAQSCHFDEANNLVIDYIIELNQNNDFVSHSKS